jgi:hypothetical protein
MSEGSDSTFWLIVVAIVAFVACKCFSCWCDCQIDKMREQTQAEYWKSQAEIFQKYCAVLEKQREAQQEIIKTLQR